MMDRNAVEQPSSPLDVLGDNHQVLSVLLRLAAMPGPVPLSVLAEQVGAKPCGEALTRAGYLVAVSGDEVALVDDSIAAELRSRWSEAYRGICRQLAWWAGDMLLHQEEPAHRRLAQTGLWRWVRDSGGPPPLSLRAAWATALEHLPADAAFRLPLVADWYTVLSASATVPVEEVAQAGLLRVQLLSEVGAWTQASELVGTWATRLGDLVGEGRADLRPLLARCLVLRAIVRQHRNLASLAVDDCQRALEMYEVETQAVNAACVAEARRTLGQALAAWRGAQPRPAAEALAAGA